MARLEDLTPGARVTGVVAGQAVTVVAVQWHGTAALTLTYPRRRRATRRAAPLPGRRSAASASTAPGPAWSLTADGALFRLVSEARRIQLAYLFDPLLAVSTSNVMPLPHQISAVYEEMLDPPAAALPARRRPRRRQDHHGRPAHQGAHGARRRQARAHRLPGHARRPVAGRAAREVPPRLRDRHAADDRRLVRRQPVPREGPADRAPRPPLAQRGAAGQAGAERVGPRDLRRGPQDVGALLRQRGQGDQALQARHAPRRGDAPPAADDGDAAPRQARGLRSLHGAARLRPLRRQGARQEGAEQGGRRPRHDAPPHQGAAAPHGRAAAVPRAPRLRRQVRALQATRPTSTTRSPPTCARR